MACILIVEDEVPLRRLLRLALECAGYEVVEASNGLEGLARYHQTAIELVITDLEMPEMDGMTMIGALRSEQAQLPIIVTSGMPEQGKRLQGCEVQYILPKPFGLHELLNTIHTLTGGANTKVPVA